MTPEQKLKSLGIMIPQAAKPVANYVPWVKSGNLIFVSGQLPFREGKLLHIGLTGESVSLEDAAMEAKQSALNIIAQLADACDGDLTKIARIVKLTGFVACPPTFTQHPAVINGASNFLAEVFGENGRHARSAVGVASLPFNACVEIEAIVEIG